MRLLRKNTTARPLNATKVPCRMFSGRSNACHVVGSCLVITLIFQFNQLSVLRELIPTSSMSTLTTITAAKLSTTTSSITTSSSTVQPVRLNRTAFWDKETFLQHKRDTIANKTIFCSTCLFNPEVFTGVTCKARAEYHASKYRNDGDVVAAQNDIMMQQPIRCVQNVFRDGKNERLSSLGLINNNRTTPPWFIEGTKVLRENQGAITMSNICLQSSDGKIPLRFISYNPMGGDDDAAAATSKPFYLHHAKTSPGTQRLLEKTYPLDWITWRDTIIKDTFDDGDGDDGLVTVPSRIEEHTLFVPDWNESPNPGHCLNDLTFSVALDAWKLENDDLVVGDSNNVTNTRTTTKDRHDKVIRHYPRFIHSSVHKIHENDKSTTCTDMLSTRFGFLGEQIPLQMTSKSGSSTSSVICFASLTIPKLTALRHTRNPTVDASLKNLRSRSFAVLSETAGIIDDPWPNSNNQLEEVPAIFLYDRSDASSRHLANASQIRSELEDRYHVHVNHYNGSLWSQLDHTSQIQVFNRHRYILSPHGAQLVNVLTARPGTKVLEIQCLVPNNKRWAQHQRWFSAWGSIIDLDWRVWMEKDGCRDPPPDGPLSMTYSPKSVYVNVTAFVDVAATHFGLQPRKK